MKRITLFSLVLLIGCAGNTEPKLEEWVDGVYQMRRLSAYSITGKRDGGTTRALAVFSLESGEGLSIKLKVDYDPQPVLSEGHWRLEGTRADSGTVHAESMRFLGGQSQGPSIGGRFRLDGNGQPRFRAVLPLRPVSKSKWKSR